MTYPGSWFGALPGTALTGAGGSFGPPTTLTIAGGIAVKGTAGRNILLAGQGGLADSLDALTGYAEGDMVVIGPSSGTVTITITDSVGMNLQGIDFIMDDINDSIILMNQGTNTWKELSRAAN